MLWSETEWINYFGSKIAIIVDITEGVPEGASG